MKKAFCILVPLILCVPLLFAQVKFTATASKTSVAVGEQFKVIFSIKANADRFDLPDVGAFQVYNTNEARNVITNHSDTTFDLTYSCIVAAKKEGIFYIGPAAVVVNAKDVFSDSLKIEVKGRFPAGQQQEVNIPDPFADQYISEPGHEDMKALAKQIFIRVEADKTDAYVGEPINVTYKLYTRVDIVGTRFGKAPALKGFRNHGVIQPNEQANAWTIKNVNGVDYHVTIIKQFLVSPAHSGDLTIAPLTMAATLQIPEKGGIDNAEGSRHELKYELKSPAVIIHTIAVREK